MLSKVSKIYREIRKVGVSDWIWFVVYLNRNEFSRKLDMERYSDPKLLVKARNRAHNVDLALSEVS